VIELSDGEREALARIAAPYIDPTAPRPDARITYDVGSALAKLAPTAAPAVTLTALRLIAEGSDHSGEIAREALERIGDRVSPDAPEGPP
jgi:hypothetical protein